MKTLKLTTEEGKTYKAILSNDLEELSTSKLNKAFDIQDYEDYWSIAVDLNGDDGETENLEFIFEKDGFEKTFIPRYAFHWINSERDSCIINTLQFKVEVK